MPLWADTAQAHGWHHCLAPATAAASSAPDRGAAETLLHPGLGLSGCLRGKSPAETTAGGGKWSRESK